MLLRATVGAGGKGVGGKGAGMGAGKDAALQHPKYQTSPITIGAASVATIAADIAR